jgi:predicted nuclease with TOPRIM domain
VWEQIKEVKGAYEEGLILKSLKYIQASIVDLEQKYKDIQAKVAENNAEMTRKLNEIQASTTRVENHHETIKRTVKQLPKT